MPPELNSTLLYKAHRNALVDYANGILHDRASAEDVVQVAWEKFHNAEVGKPLTEPLRYFYRIVRNLALDVQRAKKRDALRNNTGISDISDIIPDNTPSPEAQMVAREDLQIVLECINEMPERNRIALTLHNVEGLKLREVAERLGLSVTFTHQLIAEAKLHCIKHLSSYKKNKAK